MPADADDPFHPFGDPVGPAFTDVADGHSECTLEVTDDLKNPHGVVHGSGSLVHLASEVRHDGAAVAHAVGSFFLHGTDPRR